MFNAPTSENKQPADAGRNQLQPEPKPALHPHFAAGFGQLVATAGGRPQVSPLHGRFSRLQSTYGNQAVLRMLDRSRPVLQTKLAVNQPGDPFEQEADRVADQVMRMAAPGPVVQRSCSACRQEEKLQRKCTACEEEDKQEGLHRKEAGSRPNTAPAIVHDVLQSPGEPLDSDTRAFMEPRLGQDFGGVRLHRDARATESARAVNALTYTVGCDIVFASAQYDPASQAGRRLLAHELTHVVQQGSAAGTCGAVPGLQRQDEREIPYISDILHTVRSAASAAAAVGSAVYDVASAVSSAASDIASTVSDVATSLASILPSLPAPCTPATSSFMARTLYAYVISSYLPYARGKFGAQTTGLWAEYLNPALGMPRPAQAFSGSGEIVNGFTAHHKSAEAERAVIDASVAGLGGAAAVSMPAPGTTITVPVSTLVPAATLSTRINTETDPMGLNYDSPATTIPGNIAGGIGWGGPPGNTAMDRDTRGVDGNMQLTLDPGGANLTLTPRLTFRVHDTVDFCPGALGGTMARFETVPMSILEATEGIFGPIFAADVPFDVTYPGPGVARTVTAPTPPTVSVTPPVPPTPTPTTSTPPSDLPCTISADRGITGDRVSFRIGNAMVGTSVQTAAIRAFVSRWRTAGSSDDVSVDGYASVDGPNDLNWRLSCRRALAVAGALARDIPSNRIATRAHGPTDEFSPSDPTQNRVAVMSTTLGSTPPGPVPPGPTPPGPVPPGPVVGGGVTLRSARFVSDHHVMKDNRADWEKSDRVFPKPDWKPANPGGQSAPISQDRDSKVSVQLTLDASIGNPAGVPFTLTGQSSAGFLTFSSTGTLYDGANQVIVLTSMGTTPNAIQAFLGESINWSIQLPSGTQPLGVMRGLDIFVTMAAPRKPDEVTYKRMAKAVELTGSIHTLDPQALVHGIMLNFGAYNLDVQYDNAWKMADNIALGAQCIDIVHFVMGLIETVGCPGVAEAKLIWAKPTDPATAVESDYLGGHSLYDYPPHPAHSDWGAALIDANACPNNFEAALKFTFGDTRYYPGGVPLIDAGGRKIIFSSAQQVLEIFQYLAWVQGTGIEKTWIAQEFLISYSHRRTDKVPFTLVCDSKVLP